MNDTVSTVASTLRVVAEQVRNAEDRSQLLNTADEVEASWDGDCCPLCQEVTCDDSCPLGRDRAKAHQAPCGFVHEQWDGPYRMKRRCVAEAGHTTGQLAYDHGPWESVR